ncbi:MBL fold metallo-hydrolase [Mycolicibacterium sp. 050158]|jgi:glyoxylase-like metal-dependent hydrolase (beta-lactamase superfamily II)|uniref:MBL fold metallo-hydrolase n=1 Tax=Mycolicibacterium sp. 050158 TaxID=3090602 RepID=UPI00299F2790|nr:MBL fold metallo-hydrolase [Mycolicibacterium sp. 050158]MDX1892023.1 MBL fold metallo-hydrolase [Mycolicibacterium sp. 050158]
MNQDWESLATGVYRCRLAFLDVTVGLVLGSEGVLLIDSGTTFDEARSIEADVLAFDQRGVTRVVLTHDHFDHILGSTVFAEAAVHAMPAVAETMLHRTDYLRAHALEYGAAEADVDAVIAAVRIPQHLGARASIDLGDRTVEVEHPGIGHTDHDLIVRVPPLHATDPNVVFCGDLVEESGDPSVAPESDVAQWPATLDRVMDVGGPGAVYVPGHGAVVDANFIRRQQRWLRGR